MASRRRCAPWHEMEPRWRHRPTGPPCALEVFGNLGRWQPQHLLPTYVPQNVGPIQHGTNIASGDGGGEGEVVNADSQPFRICLWLSAPPKQPLHSGIQKTRRVVQRVLIGRRLAAVI